MPALTLTPLQRRQHRADAHHLDPVVMVGAEGLTEAVQREVDGALAAHGLVKVRVAGDDREARAAMLAQLSEALSAAPVQHIGKLLVLWRPPVRKPKAEEAEPAAPGKRAPKVVKIVKFGKSASHRPEVKKVTVLGNQRVTAGGSIKRAKARSGSVKKSARG